MEMPKTLKNVAVHAQLTMSLSIQKQYWLIICRDPSYGCRATHDLFGSNVQLNARDYFRFY